MLTIKIDIKDYDLNTLPDEARAQLTSLQFVDSELARLTNQTAASSYFFLTPSGA